MLQLDEHELSCPVCRARQPWQATCRRCEADLRLYVKALHSLHSVQRQKAAAHNSGDEFKCQATAQYLAWLHPQTAKQFTPAR